MSTEQKGWLSVNLVQLNQYCNTDPPAEAASPFRAALLTASCSALSEPCFCHHRKGFRNRNEVQWLPRVLLLEREDVTDIRERSYPFLLNALGEKDILCQLCQLYSGTVLVKFSSFSIFWQVQKLESRTRPAYLMQNAID